MKKNYTINYYSMSSFFTYACGFLITSHSNPLSVAEQVLYERDEGGRGQGLTHPWPHAPQRRAN